MFDLKRPSAALRNMLHPDDIQIKNSTIVACSSIITHLGQYFYPKKILTSPSSIQHVQCTLQCTVQCTHSVVFGFVHNMFCNVLPCLSTAAIPNDRGEGSSCALGSLF